MLTRVRCTVWALAWILGVSAALAEVPLPGAQERAQAIVALALADTIDAAGTSKLVAALDDPDESVRLGAAVAACHSTAVSGSVFTYALGVVHTSIRPALRKKPSEQVWTLTPDAAARAVSTCVPPTLPLPKLARLKAAAVDTNSLTRDVAQFVLSQDAQVSPSLGAEIDALIFDDRVNLLYRLELSAMCIGRLQKRVVPLIVQAVDRDGELAQAGEAMMGLMVRAGLSGLLADVVAQPQGRASLMAARVLFGAVRDDAAAREALKTAYRVPTLQPAVRTYIESETAKLKHR